MENLTVNDALSVTGYDMPLQGNEAGAQPTHD
jgi:hypothetical protein